MLNYKVTLDVLPIQKIPGRRHTEGAMVTLLRFGLINTSLLSLFLMSMK